MRGWAEVANQSPAFRLAREVLTAVLCEGSNFENESVLGRSLV